MFLFKVIDSLEKYKVDYAIAGGYAVALHGAVRGTVDIDFVIKLSKQSFIRAEKALNEIRLYSRLPVSSEEVFNFRQEYIKNKNMISWNFINPDNPAESVNIIITEDLRNMKIKKIKINNKSIKLLSIEDLIKMKEKSERAQDIEDINALRRIKK
ncbi:MAG: DUF6036 family nucleotidyltransferase [Thermodesulfobacteriota bacterium]